MPQTHVVTCGRSASFSTKLLLVACHSVDGPALKSAPPSCARFPALSGRLYRRAYGQSSNDAWPKNPCSATSARQRFRQLWKRFSQGGLRSPKQPKTELRALRVRLGCIASGTFGSGKRTLSCLWVPTKELSFLAP